MINMFSTLGTFCESQLVEVNQNISGMLMGVELRQKSYIFQKILIPCPKSTFKMRI